MFIKFNLCLEQVSNGDTPKASDALSGELWEVKKLRIRNASVHGKLPGWDLRSVSSALFGNFLTEVPTIHIHLKLSMEYSVLARLPC